MCWILIRNCVGKLRLTLIRVPPPFYMWRGERCLKRREADPKGGMLHLGIIGTTDIFFHFASCRRGCGGVLGNPLECIAIWAHDVITLAASGLSGCPDALGPSNQCARNWVWCAQPSFGSPVPYWPSPCSLNETWTCVFLDLPDTSIYLELYNTLHIIELILLNTMIENICWKDQLSECLFGSCLLWNGLSLTQLLPFMSVTPHPALSF